MIESAENIIQLVLTGVCVCISVYRAARTKERVWVLLGLFAGIFFLGDLYWQLFLIFYHGTPQFYSVADLTWYTAFLFLLLLLIYVRVDIYGQHMPEGVFRPVGLRGWARQFSPVLWLIPAFTGGMCVFYMQWGDYLGNILSAILMTGLLWHAASGLMSLRGEAGKRSIFIVTLLFCLLEYAVWTSSCFWGGDSLSNVYYWFDFLLSCTFLLFPRALRKAVGR